MADGNEKCALRPLLERQLDKVHFFEIMNDCKIQNITESLKITIIDNIIKEIYEVDDLRECLLKIEQEDNRHVKYLNLQYFVRSIVEPIFVIRDKIHTLKFDEGGNIQRKDILHKWWKSAAYGISKCIFVENVDNVEDGEDLEDLEDLENLQDLQDLQDLEIIERMKNIGNVEKMENVENIENVENLEEEE